MTIQLKLSNICFHNFFMMFTKSCYKISYASLPIHCSSTTKTNKWNFIRLHYSTCCKENNGTTRNGTNKHFRGRTQTGNGRNFMFLCPTKVKIYPLKMVINGLLLRFETISSSGIISGSLRRLNVMMTAPRSAFK